MKAQRGEKGTEQGLEASRNGLWGLRRASSRLYNMRMPGYSSAVIEAATRFQKDPVKVHGDFNCRWNNLTLEKDNRLELLEPKKDKSVAGRKEWKYLDS